MPSSYWPFPAFPLSPFSRTASPTPSTTQTAHAYFPFSSQTPALSTTDSPSRDVSPVTPAQEMEWEDADLLSVDRALMDFAAGEADREEEWMREERDVRVKALWVHPIKSCRGVSVQKSVVTSQGLQYDRQWAIREVETSQMCTAREYPSMVLIEPEIDEINNLLIVRFPEATGLPGFAVKLNVDESEIRTWQKVGPTIMHKKPLPAAFVPPHVPFVASVDPNLTPSAQLSTYLSRPVQFIQKSPFEEDKRPLVPPPGSPDWLVGGDVEYAEKRGAETGFADGYPVLLASEESFRDIQASLEASLNPRGDSLFANIGPTFNKPVWQKKKLDLRRFRANVIVGSGPTSSDRVQAWEEETWRDVEFWGQAEEDQVQVVEGEDDVTMNTDKAQQVGRFVRRGGMVCVSRCGRCQLPNVDPDNAEADKAVPYKIIAKYRRVDPAQKFTPIFGVNAVPREERSLVCVGDRVRVTGKNTWQVIERS
ncbi:hypothetical protein NliqN6_6513 [Naganishia liquefaciens]|uniref:MOSC domain-containing protein n=1 Tax=Naganishia liquefaciens TaxID=104408 RepID=A0A8H3U046_9TREE|nr:hypothetical protein NliqN6_6513 [Naganishia liquefaciens]